MNKLGDDWPLYTCTECKAPFTSLEPSERCRELDRAIRSTAEHEMAAFVGQVAGQNSA